MYFHEIYSLFLSHVKSWKSNRPNWVKLLEIETGTQLKLRKAIFCKPAQDFRFVIVISYLLFFFGEEKFSCLPSKNKVADKNLHFQRHTNFLVKLQCFLSVTLFLKGSEQNFFCPKKIVN